MRLSELLGCEVLTESGRSLRRVWEVRAEPSGGELRLVGLLVGRFALAQRLGLWPRQPRRASDAAGEGIPWNAVVRLEPGRIIVRDGTRREEL
jgi:sporulation protein YlmC with PRC-barrel domain